ncbi:hypothetical protein [Agromyces humatus]|uniref:Uncharacterized protein n=1 Tax=Agromyces humatus TaxID=279573 RepID=A0ABN2KVI4_9MICO|nr:hypothetical protein [Agromyces humatus]
MEHVNLDERLSAAAPSVMALDRELDTALDRVLEQRVRTTPRRHRRTLLVTAAASVLVFGGASAALASPSFQELLKGMSLDRSTALVGESGQDCATGWVIKAEPGVPADDPVVLEAQKILQAMDIDSIPIDPVTLQEQRELSDRFAKAAAARGEDPADLTWNDPELSALHSAVTFAVFDRLTAEGYDASRIHIEGVADCVAP